MDHEIDDKSLLELISGQADGAWPQGIGKVFRRRLTTIISATDERTFYELKSLHYEKLKGDRSHQRSMRLNKALRLIVELE